MEKHFLADQMEGTPEFRAEPWYNPHGDCIVFQMVDEAVVAERIDGVLTIYRSAIDDRPIGFQVKGVHAIISTFGLDGLAVSSQAAGSQVRSIWIAALLLAAYEQGPTTLSRRRAYAAAMDCPTEGRSVAVDDLLPA